MVIGGCMDKEEIKQKYINAAIEIGAKEGVTAVTMRAMSNHAGINTAYMYRVFDDVYQVQQQAFLQINTLFVKNLSKRLIVFENYGFSEEVFKQFFNESFDSVRENSIMFEFFLRYYYNYVFPRDFATSGSKEELEPILNRIEKFFKKDTPLIPIILIALENYVKYSILIDKSGDLEKRKEEVYQIIYNCVTPYLLTKN